MADHFHFTVLSIYPGLSPAKLIHIGAGAKRTKRLGSSRVWVLPENGRINESEVEMKFKNCPLVKTGLAQ